MSRLLQVLHEDGLTCPVLVERVRGAPGRSINWLGSVLARVRSQYPEVGSDVSIMPCVMSCVQVNLRDLCRLINEWCMDQIKHGVRARPDIER